MAENERDTIEIPLPVEIFDVEGAVVQRLRRVSVARVQRVRQTARTVGGQALFEELADIYPEWQSVTDADTGEALPNPAEDGGGVFFRLDYTEQIAWFVEAGLAYSPNRLRKAA